MPTAIYKTEDGLKVMLVTKEHNLSEVLDAMEQVIKASGFYIKDGSLDIKDEDEHEESAT